MVALASDGLDTALAEHVAGLQPKMTGTLERSEVFTVVMWRTPQPGFQYEAHIYRGGVLEIVAGGMTDAEAEQAARDWIEQNYAQQTETREQVRAFTVEVSS